MTSSNVHRSQIRRKWAEGQQRMSRTLQSLQSYNKSFSRRRNQKRPNLIFGLSVCRFGRCLVSPRDGDGLRCRGHGGGGGVSRLLLLLLLRRGRRRRLLLRWLLRRLLRQRRLWLLLILRLLRLSVRLSRQLLQLQLLLLWRRRVFDYWKLLPLALPFVILQFVHCFHRWHQFGLFLCLK